MIDSFTGEYEWLSNFYPSEIKINGITYATVEHAYQEAKTLDPEEREAIRTAETPGRAKRLGQKCTVREDWEKIKYGIMLDLVRRKFDTGDFLAKLRDTGDQEIVEGNTWGDTYWGVCDGIGDNKLGKILMWVRKWQFDTYIGES